MLIISYEYSQVICKLYLDQYSRVICKFHLINIQELYANYISSIFKSYIQITSHQYMQIISYQFSQVISKLHLIAHSRVTCKLYLINIHDYRFTSQ